MTAPVAELVEHIAHFQHRVIQDALEDATAIYWLRRATAFENARPRAGDYWGQATAAELKQRDADLAEIATACRTRADWSLRRGTA